MPSVPGNSYMLLNGGDTTASQPLVAYLADYPHTFQWDDPDGGSTFELQMATRSDFGLHPLNGVPSTFLIQENITNSSWDWAGGVQYGVIFWRIRANDGLTTSGWSPVGSFTVNQPPRRPTTLTAQQR